jgi:hypothetical protein
MSDGLGLLTPVTAPLLEKVVREERMGRDHPRKRQEQKADSSKEDGGDGANSDDAASDTGTSMSSNHIDLRI